MTTLTVETAGADETRRLGRRLARLLGPGDVVVLSGGLGAGKTTLTQGIGAGLGVRGDVTSPTFVISRVHPSVGTGPALVHVDAYRLQGAGELDDLDLDVTVETAVTVVEWGDGLADGLSADRLLVHLVRTPVASEVAADVEPGVDDEPRTVTLEAVGPRWTDVDLERALAASADPGSARP